MALKKTSNSDRGHISALLDAFAFSLLGLMILAYSIYTSDFAEYHIRFSLFNCPIFVGEILMGVCFGLFLMKAWISPPRWNAWGYAWIGYGLYIAGRALYELPRAGLLTLRNAALFYYLFFAFFGFYFYRTSLVRQTQRVKVLFFFLCFLMVTFRLLNDYYYPLFFLLALAVGFSIKDKMLRYGLLGVLLMGGHLFSFFQGCRSYLVGVVLAMSYVMTFFLFRLLRITMFYRIILGILIIWAGIMGIIRYSDRNGVVSLVTPKVLIQYYKFYEYQVAAHGKKYKKIPLPIKLYHDNKAPTTSVGETVSPSRSFASEILPKYSAATDVSDDKRPALSSSAPVLGSSEDRSVETTARDGALTAGQLLAGDTGESPGALTANSQSAGGRERNLSSRSLDTAYMNMLFRIFIWKDMWEELFQKKAVFGLGFGWPQRSRSLEILDWGAVEWKRDGWITPHNSYFHMIYRAGILGAALVLFVIGLLFSLMKTFFSARSVIGVFLTSILIYWMTMANFLLVFELPYYAIPFWTIFGITWAYKEQLIHPDKSSGTL